ncbi:DivIVA domain-containing protein [Plantactinospora sp. BB1]|uniref:DivIVA domain-containing protein n=1 Tax=Plantactinospora sp. BB1 TaxID=2071627 RepID=UPI000D160308|nr:DivIVA domain-containing protein [Plantactinospora sp. BB1]AVT35378.1 hypothetical protein C6W10_01655 [Plantactinospora sp. BB1]
MSQLTPSDIRNVSFRKPTLGRRGYDEQDVDEFLDRVESTISALIEELTVLGGRPTSTVAPAVTAAGVATGVATGGVATEPQAAILAQLEEIRARLTRIEAAVSGGGPRSPFGDPLFRS